MGVHRGNSQTKTEALIDEGMRQLYSAVSFFYCNFVFFLQKMLIKV